MDWTGWTGWILLRSLVQLEHLAVLIKAVSVVLSDYGDMLNYALGLGGLYWQEKRSTKILDIDMDMEKRRAEVEIN